MKVILEVAPPGFSGTVKAMKKKMPKEKAFALAWHMYKKGDKPHKKPESGKPRYKSPKEYYKESLDEKLSKLFNLNENEGDISHLRPSSHVTQQQKDDLVDGLSIWVSEQFKIPDNVEYSHDQYGYSIQSDLNMEEITLIYPAQNVTEDCDWLGVSPAEYLEVLNSLLGTDFGEYTSRTQTFPHGKATEYGWEDEIEVKIRAMMILSHVRSLYDGGEPDVDDVELTFEVNIDYSDDRPPVFEGP